jgi:hypothetical protein
MHVHKVKLERHDPAWNFELENTDVYSENS